MPKLPKNYENWLYRNRNYEKQKPDYEDIADDLRDEKLEKE